MNKILPRCSIGTFGNILSHFIVGDMFLGARFPTDTFPLKVSLHDPLGILAKLEEVKSADVLKRGSHQLSAAVFAND